MIIFYKPQLNQEIFKIFILENHFPLPLLHSLKEMTLANKELFTYNRQIIQIQ